MMPWRRIGISRFPCIVTIMGSSVIGMLCVVLMVVVSWGTGSGTTYPDPFTVSPFRTDTSTIPLDRETGHQGMVFLERDANFHGFYKEPLEVTRVPLKTPYLTFSYPSGMALTSTQDNSFLYYALKGTGSLGLFTALISKKTDSSNTLSSFTDSWEQMLLKTFKQATVVDSGEKYVAGEPASWFLLEFNDANGVRTRSMNICIESQDRFVILSYNTYPALGSDNEQGQAILDSMVFTPVTRTTIAPGKTPTKTKAPGKTPTKKATPTGTQKIEWRTYTSTWFSVKYPKSFDAEVNTLSDTSTQYIFQDPATGFAVLIGESEWKQGTSVPLSEQEEVNREYIGSEGYKVTSSVTKRIGSRSAYYLTYSGTKDGTGIQGIDAGMMYRDRMYVFSIPPTAESLFKQKSPLFSTMLSSFTFRR
jgi:hypothetical protein